MKINCLTYLLDLWQRGHRFTILTNVDHYIGVNEKKIFELGNTFKKDLMSGYALTGGSSYERIETAHKKETVKKIFNLTEEQYKILEEYYEHV